MMMMMIVKAASHLWVEVWFHSHQKLLEKTTSPKFQWLFGTVWSCMYILNRQSRQEESHAFCSSWSRSLSSESRPTGFIYLQHYQALIFEMLALATKVRCRFLLDTLRSMKVYRFFATEPFVLNILPVSFGSLSDSKSHEQLQVQTIFFYPTPWTTILVTICFILFFCHVFPWLVVNSRLSDAQPRRASERRGLGHGGGPLAGGDVGNRNSALILI